MSSVLTLPDLSRFCQTVPAELPSLPLNQKRELPRVPAVYLVLGEHSEVLYIGKSGSLSHRWVRHHRASELQKLRDVRVAWIEMETRELLEEVERVLIDHFSPRMNGLRDRSDPDYRTGTGVFLRMTTEEKEVLETVASRSNRSLADWLRQLARDEVRERGLLSGPEKKSRKVKP